MTDDLGDDAQTLLTKFSIKSLLLRVSENKVEQNMQTAFKNVCICGSLFQF